MIGIVVSIYFIYENINKYHVSAKKYQELAEIYTSKMEEESDVESKPVDLKDINEEYVGWLQIEDTPINYPVVQTTNNEFYLNHNFYKESDFSGSIFMDYRNASETLDRNIVLYGHNMKDESMFGALKHYLENDFFEQHRTIVFEFLDEHHEWEIFSAYSSPTSEWMNVEFENEEAYLEYLEEIQQKSVIDSTVPLDADSKILTLGTCTELQHERFVVHAVKVEGKGGAH